MWHRNCFKIGSPVTLCLLAAAVQVSVAVPNEIRAPFITQEPPSRVSFLNGSGASLHCSASGSPPPQLTWLAEGGPAPDLAGLRMSLPNGTLVFLPFHGDRYRQDVHGATYRCLAVNVAGRTGSRDVKVRAVVQQRYEVKVYDEFVIRGNTAVLRCLIPAVVRDVVIVTSWEREDGLTIVSNVASGGRYSVLPNGELHIRNAMMNDGFKFYHCQTKHLLSGEVQVSTSSGRLIITDPQSTHPPRLSETRATVQVQEGEEAELTCVAQAYPLPTYRWFKKSGGLLTLKEPQSGSIQLEGSLYLRKVWLQDAGTYICVVKNSAGEARIETTLIVTAPLVSQMRPQRLLVDVGRPITLNCNISGFPLDHVRWVRNQQPITFGLGGASARVRLPSPQMLHLGAVLREDRGIYQCYVHNSHDSAQSTTELALAETVPEIVERFREATLQPGPTLSLQCVASGVPLPQVTWTVDGQPVPDNERVRVGDFVNRKGDVVSHVNISAIRVQDGGLYACTARSEVGEAVHGAKVNVYGPPVVRPMPDQSTVAGETATVRCLVAGYPITDVRWQKDGRFLPTNRRQRVLANGTLVLATVQRSEDEGTYTCIVKGKDATAEGSVKVRVKEKPVVLPLSIPEEIQEGMKIRLICQVAAGDPPFRITWQRDGLPLRQLDGLTIKHPEEDVSSLTFESVRQLHNGQYTCLVRNDVATVVNSAKLTVLVPPRWVMEPRDSDVVIGQGTMLHCQAEGFPPPQIRWEKSQEKTGGGNYRPLTTNYHYQAFENGSLAIQEVVREDAGSYLCQASNEIGPGLSTVISVTTHAAPKFESNFRTQLIKKADEVTLACEASGDQPLTMTWARDKQPFDPEMEPRYHLKKSKRPDGLKAELVLPSVGRTDSALYTCTATNKYGADDTNIQLIVQEPPDPPRDVKIIGTSSRFVRLSWEPPFSGNSLITNYYVRFLEAASSGVGQQNASVPPAETTIEVSNLRPSVKYEFQILARNTVGISAPSQTLTITTDEEVPEAPPEMIRLEAVSSKSLKVSFKPPPRLYQNGPIRGYYIGYRERNSSEPFQYKTVEVKAGDGQQLNVVGLQPELVEAELKGLSKFTTYAVVVQAFNNRGAGPRSDPVFGTTREDVPSLPPQEVGCLSLGPTSLQLLWTPPNPSSIHGILQGFKILFRQAEAWNVYDDEEVTVKASSNQAVLERLEKYTNYSISLLAFTRRGEGVSSDAIYCRTMEDIPNPPMDIKVMPLYPDSILVAWRPPFKSNGLLIHYTLYQRTFSEGSQDTKKHVVPPVQLHYEALGLNTKRRYEFWLTCSTSVGESEPTKVVSQLTSETVPAHIASFSEQRIVSRNSQVSLPCHSVGIPPPDVQWTFGSQSTADHPRARTAPNGTLIINEVMTEDSGNYTCRVLNSFGSDEITFLLTVKARLTSDRVLAPPAFLAVTRASSNSLELKWKSSVKMSKLKGYLLRFRREYGQWEEVKIPASETSHLMETLQCGTKYLFYMTALGKWGEGEPSETITAKTAGEAPVAPSREALSVSNSTSITLSLDSWGDGGCPIKSFIVRYKRLQMNDWRVLSNNLQPQQDRVTLRELSPGVWYLVRITAHNGAGSTVSEYDIATLTQDGGTVAPVTVLDVKSEAGQPESLWSDWNMIVPILAAFTALSIVLGAAICVCFKRRHQTGDIYERPMERGRSGLGSNSNSYPKQKLDGQEATCPNREPLYQSNLHAKRHSTHSAREAAVAATANTDYADDITPYATFRLPGCDSDTESSYSTGRELQTFGGVQFRPSLQGLPDSPPSPQPPSAAHPEEQLTLDYQSGRLPKQVEYELYSQVPMRSGRHAPSTASGHRLLDLRGQQHRQQHHGDSQQQQQQQQTHEHQKQGQGNSTLTWWSKELEAASPAVALQQQSKEENRPPYQCLVKLISPSKKRLEEYRHEKMRHFLSGTTNHDQPPHPQQPRACAFEWDGSAACR